MKYQGKITDPKDLVTKEYVDTGLSGKQNTLTFDDAPTAGSSNPVKSSGIKSALNDAKALSFTVTLTAAGWSSNAQTVSNAYFVASGYAYTVAPTSSSFADYADAQIYADDVTANGSMTFHCDSAPSSDLTVNILRTEVSA